jgi:hypothetical protein
LSYRVEKIRNEYVIKEKGSDLTIASFRRNREARTLCRGLNLGQGFNGHTPEFFIQEFKSIKKATTLDE